MAQVRPAAREPRADRRAAQPEGERRARSSWGQVRPEELPSYYAPLLGYPKDDDDDDVFCV